MENLSGILSFVHTAEALSFVGASRRLGLTASAVGKNVAGLEQQLGVRLLNRSTRRVSLTDDGEIFYERCRRILDDLREAEELMSRAHAAPRGKLLISLPIIGYRFLLPCLSAFTERYPEVELDLDFNDRIVDVIADGYDAVIRSGKLPDSELTGKLLGPFRFVLAASPAYLQRRGIPLQPADLAQHACLRFRFPGTRKFQQWIFKDLPEDFFVRLPVALTCNNMEALRGAAINGLGLAYMPDFLVHEDLRSGALHSVLAGHLDAEGQFSVLWPSKKHMSPKLRAFIEFISAHLFSGYLPASEGAPPRSAAVPASGKKAARVRQKR
ncbi:LysR family transcriptional regulator [Herbaspirillum lusitanum]|uniref:LysR family transcriptional regulator n=1 Tax=Herbaspirillum lusitanum TaxID=213312 RepID=A0ABW9A4C9_9BURK